MNARAVLISGFLSLVMAGPALATIPTAVVTAGDNYLEELNHVERAGKRQSLELLFTMAADLAEILRSPDRSRIYPLDSLTENEFATLRSKFRGLILEREAVSTAYVDPEFFEKLGERKGRTEDRLFLRLYHRASPNGLWAAYMEPRTDEAGCFSFGNGTLVSLFSEWRGYGERHPKQYAAFVRYAMDEIRDVLTKETCACGSPGSVQSELRFFLRRFPKDTVAPIVQRRLDQVRHGTSDFRFNCRPG